MTDRRERTIIAVIALATVLATACARRSLTRSEGVQRLRDTIALTRDHFPHPGARADDLTPERMQAAASAADAESARRAMAKLLDELDDGHAAVRPLQGDLPGPEDCVVIVADGSRWLGTFAEDTRLSALLNWCPTPVGVPSDRRAPREWMRIERIDGYAPRRDAAVLALLEGPLGTTVEVEGTLIDGSAVRRVLTRGTPERWGFLGASSIDTIADPFAGWLEFGDPLPEFFKREAPIPDRPPFASARVGPDGRVGYLRLERLDSGDRCSKPDCQLDPCADRLAVAAAIETLLECDTIILDISGNGGGTCSHAGEVMRRLLPRSAERVPMVHLELDGSDPESRRWPVEPAARRFGGRLIVLTDEATGSAAEHLAAILKGMPGVTLIGAPTGGFEFSVCKCTFEADGFVARFGGRGTEWDPPHRSAEGVPIEPDIMVPLDAKLLAQFGPPAALAQRRIDQVVAAWREAGLRGPRTGDWADLKSFIPWRLGRVVVWWLRAGAILALATAIGVAWAIVRRLRRRRAAVA